ncbi:hypothetical protein N7541_003279 [Penicillium brevicompactum]|uniref:Uncharacterized protein n=1 Tax=Penicillium brevicompactum TaxID=5074 RepID=A0A9W9RLJ3_PENBR|nr:hypothetical protein N7541_003279 [Penicillium brevicompactum]
MIRPSGSRTRPLASTYQSSRGIATGSGQLPSRRLEADSHQLQIIRPQCTSTLTTNSPKDVQFDKVDLNHLHTSVGTFNLENVVPMKTSLNRSAPLPNQTGYSLNDDRIWITYKGENLLWLPSECRSAVVSSSSIPSNMAIGCSSGRVLIFSFSKETPVITPQT